MKRIRRKTPLRRLKRTKVKRGWCRKNLHRMVGDNVEYRQGTRRCRACQAAKHRIRRQEARALGWRREKCQVVGCHTYTERYVFNEPYYCGKHRDVLLEAA